MMLSLTNLSGFGAGTTTSVAKTYATFSSSRISSGILLSNSNLTAEINNTLNNVIYYAYLDTIADKTSGIWSMEVTVHIGTVSVFNSPTIGGFQESLITSGSMAGNYSFAQAVSTSSGRPIIITSGSVYALKPNLAIGSTGLLILDFTNRYIGAKNTDFADGYRWGGAAAGTGQLYVAIPMAYATVGAIKPKVTINTGQTPFSADSKLILSKISGANEGIWV